MRKLVYHVAMSLDGYIAGPKGEFDWIPDDPDIDFTEIMGRFDTLVMGRKTWEITKQMEGPDMGMRVVVFSKTLRQEDEPKAIISRDIKQSVTELKQEQGKDIWLFGGGELFRELLDLGLVDEVSIAIAPILLGGGIPALQPQAQMKKLKYVKHRLYEKSGFMMVDYLVIG